MIMQNEQYKLMNIYYDYNNRRLVFVTLIRVSLPIRENPHAGIRTQPVNKPEIARVYSGLPPQTSFM